MISRVLTLVLVTVLLSGCMVVDYWGKTPSPHESFKNHYNWYVGKTIQFFRTGSAPPEGKAKRLPNGNLEDEYWLYKGACRIYYEYNPETGIIVRWRFEGGEQNCVQNPYT